MPFLKTDYNKFRCLASPRDQMRGLILRRFHLERMAKDGQLPSGSVWNNGEVFLQIEGCELEEQTLIEVSDTRLKLLVSRFPVLRLYTGDAIKD